MDSATVIGFTLALVSVCATVIAEGGKLLTLINLPASIIVFGGTAAAIMVSFPVNRIAAIPALTKF